MRVGLYLAAVFIGPGAEGWGLVWQKMPRAMAVIIIMVVIVFICLAPVCGGLTSVVLLYNSMFSGFVSVLCVI